MMIKTSKIAKILKIQDLLRDQEFQASNHVWSDLNIQTRYDLKCFRSHRGTLEEWLKCVKWNDLYREQG